MAGEDEAALSFAETIGLGKAATAFREDILAAAAAAKTFRQGLGIRPDPAAEPWPPMRVLKR
jgi:hypothetical protein